MMNICLPQNYLRSGGTLKDLEAIYKVKAKRHLVYTNLVQIKYDQIEANLSLPLTRQCRGLILDEETNWTIVARPFDKFFNFGEIHAAPIDWKTATIQEKLDGSLMILYYYGGKWRVATSGTPDASGEVHPSWDGSFADLFWSVWNEKKYLEPIQEHRNRTFLFELTTPYNRIVVRQDKANLRLIGVRNNLTGQESHPRMHVLFDPVREFPPSYGGSFGVLLKQFDHIDPTMQEGFVVVDRDFNRVKVKHPGYVSLHHMRSGLSPKNILEVVRAGEVSEIIAHFPEWAEAFDRIRARYEGLCLDIEQSYDEIAPTVKSRKEFAEKAIQTTVPGALFAMLDNKARTPQEYLKTMNIDGLASVLQIHQTLADLDLTKI